jgi:hypothetical protein
MEFILYHIFGVSAVLFLGGYLGWQTRGHNEALARQKVADAEHAAADFAAKVKAEVDKIVGPKA